VIRQDWIAASATFIVCAYYFLVWLLFRRLRGIRTVVPLYEAPHRLSPAMIRYIWKERFDDRTFWAGVLSLVAKGLATLHSEGGTSLIEATPQTDRRGKLPSEEEILLSELVQGHRRKGSPIDMLSARTALAAQDMAKSLRRDALGLWFTENRRIVTEASSCLQRHCCSWLVLTIRTNGKYSF